LIVPEAMAIVHFSDLDEILTFPPGLTYYKPKSSTFGVLDALIMDGNNKSCYGLQMTINQNHGIKAAPLTNFLDWLSGKGILMTQFYFGFVVLSNLASQYESQTIRTRTDQVLKKP
jgi:hypothetical protein